MEKRRKPLTCSIPSALGQVSRQEAICSRMPSLYGFQSVDIPRAFRRLVVLSNSLAIVLLQSSLLSTSFQLLKTAAKADVRLELDLSPVTWSARAITACSFAYLFQRYTVPRSQRPLLSPQVPLQSPGHPRQSQGQRGVAQFPDLPDDPCDDLCSAVEGKAVQGCAGVCEDL